MSNFPCAMSFVFKVSVRFVPLTNCGGTKWKCVVLSAPALSEWRCFITTLGVSGCGCVCVCFVPLWDVWVLQQMMTNGVWGALLSPLQKQHAHCNDLWLVSITINPQSDPPPNHQLRYFITNDKYLLCHVRLHVPATLNRSACVFGSHSTIWNCVHFLLINCLWQNFFQ